MNFASVVKKLNEEDISKFQKNKEVTKPVEEDDEPKPEDFFKDFEEEFDNKYNLNIFDIYFDTKEEINRELINIKINHDDIYNIIFKYSKESNKLKHQVEKYNNKVVEDFMEEEKENDNSDY